MNQSTDPQKENVDPKNESLNESDDVQNKEKQQRSDPNITELKGFIDPKEDLEPKGTDNKTSL
jgi:hypothetical protein